MYVEILIWHTLNFILGPPLLGGAPADEDECKREDIIGVYMFDEIYFLLVFRHVVSYRNVWRNKSMT